ncbi:MAG: carbohydrate-binding protein, partial [Moraxellaceae bacterium]
MNIRLLVCTLFFLLFSTHSYAQTWQLLWADEFDYTGYPDAYRWRPDVWAPGTTNQELQAYTASQNNANVSGGTLKITATAAYNSSTGKNDYWSARLNSTASWTYGRFEARMKLPGGYGTWPAFWLYPDNEGYYGGSWPNAGEIDIMEEVGYDPNVIHATLHSKCCNHASNNARTKAITVSNPYDWHVYSADWFPDHIQFFIDGQLYYEVWNDGTGWASWPFNHNYHFILNLAVGGSWGGAMGVDPNIWPKTLEVDYVRAYKLDALVEAEKYSSMKGVTIESTTDAGGGKDLGSIDNGDWMSYSVNVPAAGNYRISYRVASPNTGGAIKLEKAGGGATYGTVTVPKTGGWQTWQTVSHTVSLPAGAQNIGVVATVGGFNLNWIK